MLTTQATLHFEELAAGAAMRAAHRYKLSVAQLMSDEVAKGIGHTKRTVAAIDSTGATAVDALAVELLAQIDRVHASEPAEDARERAALLQNLFEVALREGGNALIATRQEAARPILQRLGVLLPPETIQERLETCARDGRARIRLSVSTRTTSLPR